MVFTWLMVCFEGYTFNGLVTVYIYIRATPGVCPGVTLTIRASTSSGQTTGICRVYIYIHNIYIYMYMYIRRMIYVMDCMHTYV